MADTSFGGLALRFCKVALGPQALSNVDANSLDFHEQDYCDPSKCMTLIRLE